ncbi:hypothetical protein AALK94_04105 [Bacteroides faecichinchillae]|uniref:hypothetical protein n=1 Tax=Bacteroides faecichinchillae TaxID=871325 RepID=UPI00351804EB
METILLIGITIVATIWIIRKENKKLKNTYRLHRANKTFSEECVRLLKYEKYGYYKLTGMKYKCLKEADYGIHHGYAIAERYNQYDKAIIIKKKDNGKIIACVENEGSRQLYDFIIQNEGKVHALYYIWKYSKNRIYGCAYIKDRDEH